MVISQQGQKPLNTEAEESMVLAAHSEDIENSVHAIVNCKNYIND
jgi:hypothetical protein